MRRPVLLALELAALAATVLFAVKLGSAAPTRAAFIGQVALWLWLSLLAISAGMATVEASHPCASTPPARAAERHPGQVPDHAA